MHILELPSFFPPYGGMFCVDQAKALAMQGNTVRIAACINMSARLSPGLYLKAPLGTYMTQVDGIEVMRKDLRGIPFFPKACAMHWVKAVEKLVDKYVEKFGKPDIIHAHCGKWAGYAAMKAAEKHGVPYVITEHLPYMILAEELGENIEKAWQVPYLREAYRRAAMVIPVSEELVGDIECFMGRDYRWKFVSNTIDVDFFSLMKREGWKNRPFTVCCVADFVPRKGYDTMFGAVKAFKDESKADVRIVVAGNGTKSEGMKDLVANYGLNGVTELCGKVDKAGVRDVLYRSDCFLFATRSEVQPLVVLEAMSTGLPVVTTEAVPKSERIESGCFVSAVDDVKGLADGLRHIYDMSSFDGTYISAAVAGLASPQNVGKELSCLFENLCEEFNASENSSCK